MLTADVSAPRSTAASRAKSPVAVATLLGLGLAGLWLVLGAWRPTTTYHLAPLLVGAVPAAFAAGHVARRTGVLLGLLGLTLALVTFAVLGAGPGLHGPTIGPFATAAQETVILAIMGGAGGAIYTALAPDRS